jgi:hypothetical protein
MEADECQPVFMRGMVKRGSGVSMALWDADVALDGWGTGKAREW